MHVKNQLKAHEIWILHMHVFDAGKPVITQVLKNVFSASLSLKAKNLSSRQPRPNRECLLSHLIAKYATQEAQKNL